MDIAREELKKLIPQRLHIPSSQLRLLDSVGHGTSMYFDSLTICIGTPLIPGQFGAYSRTSLI